MKKNKSKSITYKESGVDIDKFEIILNDLKKEILSTFNDAVIDNFGSFSSVLDINKLGYNDPLLLSSTDGVGTSASFKNPTGITTDGTSLYVADQYNHKIRHKDWCHLW